MTVVFLISFLPCTASAGFENNGRGTRPSALANAFAAVGDSPWSTVYNPAGLADCHAFEFAVFMSPQQFGLKELRTTTVALFAPLGDQKLGLVGGQFGFDLYRETALSLGIGKMASKGIALGGTINLIRFSIERYGAVTAASFDCGAIIEVVEGLHLGFDWKNFTGSTIGSTAESLPQVQAVGLCYEIAATSRVTLELEKDIRFPFEFKMGYEQEFLHMLNARFGMSNNPQTASVGFGVEFAGIGFSYAGYSHQQLGWTHQIEISFTTGR